MFFVCFYYYYLGHKRCEILHITITIILVIMSVCFDFTSEFRNLRICLFFVALMDDQPVDCFHMLTMTASPISMR